MGNPIFILLSNSISREPVAGLLLLVTACLIFARLLSRRAAASPSFFRWVRLVLEALAGALLFAGMAGAFAFLLNSQYAKFSQISGSFIISGSRARSDWLDWQSRYGGPLIQRDLIITRTIARESVEQLPMEETGGRLLYRTVQVDEPVAGNSIAGFDGRLVMALADPAAPLQSFNAYTLEADYRYSVVNPSDMTVQARFYYPLPEARLMSDLRVEMDGKEIPWQPREGGLTWERQMEPGGTAEVRVRYRVRGMDYYLFEIPEARQVTDFHLSLELNAPPSGIVTEPAEAIQMETAQKGWLITWTIPNAIVAPRLGLYMTQGWRYAPSHALIALLPHAARALLFFLALAAFTLLIASVPIDLRQLAILAAVFTIPFLLLMAGAVPRLAFILPQNWAIFQARMLPVLGLLPLALAWLALRKVPTIPRALILVLMVLFLGFYPLAGLIPDEQKRNAVLGGAQAGMIFYIFAYALFTRIRRQPKS